MTASTPSGASCAMTGCRRGEALGLTWPDLDVEAGAVTIRRALVPIDGELRETEPKTRRGRRRIALDAETVAVLRELAATQLGEQQAAGDELGRQAGGSSRKENGEQLHPERISALFRAPGARRGAAADPAPRPAPHLREHRPGQGRQPGDRLAAGWDTRPWPSPSMSTRTCCPRSLHEYVDAYLMPDLATMADVQVPQSGVGGMGFPLVQTVMAGIELLGRLELGKGKDKGFRYYWRVNISFPWLPPTARPGSMTSSINCSATASRTRLSRRAATW